MPTRQVLKRKASALKINVPIKKARVIQMKEIAKIYCRKEVQLTHKNHDFFQCFFKDQKLIYPWIERESLR